MSDTYAQFEKRLDGVNRKHKALARGYVARLGTDGLITLEPKRRGAGVRLRVIAFMIIGFFVFKAMTIAAVGLGSYDERITRLNDGIAVEKAAAWIMQSGPVTEQIAFFMASLIP